VLRTILAASAASLAFAVPAAAADDTPSPEAQAFGARPTVQQMSLSPNGSHVAIVATVDRGQATALFIGDLVNGGLPKSIVQSTGHPDRLRRCAWTSDTRVVCYVYFVDATPDHLTFSRMYSLNSDGSDRKLLTKDQKQSIYTIHQYGGDVIDWGPDGASGSILMTREIEPEFSNGTLTNDSKREGLGVEIVDTTSLSHRMVESPAVDAALFVSDGHGSIRVRGVWQREGPEAGRRIFVQYRQPGNRNWLALADLRVDGNNETGFYPEAVDKATNVAYGFDDADGHRALFSVSLDGSLKRSLLLSNKNVDIDSLITLGRNQRVVGASWVTDRRTQQFFDPELQQLRAALAKAIPDKPMINFIDASADEKRILLFAGSDNDPGMFYIFDKTSRHLEEVAPMRPELARAKLATMQPISYPAADGTPIPAYLTLPPGSSGKNLPAIVLPHGGPSARDEWGFDWLVQFFAARGYAVIQPNFRGSAGYGDAWFQKNGFQSWKTAIGDVNDAGRWLTKQGIAAPGKLAIFGWSYGGYAALQSSVLDPDLFKAIVAVAPVTDLDMLREESRDYTNFYDVDRFIGHGDYVREGSPLKNADKIKAPVLLFHGDFDVNVRVAESRAMAGKLKDLGKKVDYVEFKGLDHQLDDSATRATMLDKSDRFFRTALGLAP
jgi:dipeptidyl aminopeptidase/acylaminoacyl peptidase